MLDQNGIEASTKQSRAWTLSDSTLTKIRSRSLTDKDADVATEKPSFALVAVTFQKGGTEEVLVDVAASLLRREHRVHVLLPRLKALDALASELTSIDADVVRVPVLFDTERDVRSSFFEFLQLFRRLRPTVVHFHVPWAPVGMEAFLASYLAGVPHRLRTDHNPLVNPLPVRQRAKMRLLDSMVERVVFVSTGNKESHLRNGRSIAGKSVVIPNGIDFDDGTDGPLPEKAAIRRELGLDEGALTSMMLSSLEERKGILDFVKAASLASAQEPRMQFVVIGDGPLRAEAEALSANLGLGERLKFLGYRTDVSQILPAFDVYVQPSHYEGMALSMLRALGAGLPMVSTRVDGVLDVIDDRGAIIVDIGDIPGIADGMVKLVREGELRAKFASVGMDVVRSSFTREQMVCRYIDLYRDLGINA